MKGWYGNRQAHMLASRGIKTKYNSFGVRRVFDLENGTIDMRYNPFEDDPMDDKLLEDIPALFDMDTNKTVVHGTSLEDAIIIKEDGYIRDGTYVHAGFGGLSDAYNWSKNKCGFACKPVIIMVEIDQEEPLKRGMFGMEWITLGRKGKSSGGTRSDVDELPIKKMVVFKVPQRTKEKETDDEWYQKIEVIEI